MIRKQLRPAILLTIVFIVVTGFVYPGIVTAVAKLVFPNQASGSLVTQNGQVIGSRLIGQQFNKPWYFHPRPSAAGSGYDATASGGTNKGPTDKKLADTLVAGAIAQAESAGVEKSSPHGLKPSSARFRLAQLKSCPGVSTFLGLFRDC